MALLAVAGCGDDGRELAEPQQWQTTTTRPAPPTTPPAQQVGESGFTLSSPEFQPGGPAPADVTCAGANRHPELVWSGVPDEAAELAVTLSDHADPEVPVLLWLVAGIDPTTTGLPAGEVPPGAVEVPNDYGIPGWGSPCLDQLGEGVRPLQFRIHALPAPSELTPTSPGNEAWDQVTAQATDDASVMMTVGP